MKTRLIFIFLLTFGTLAFIFLKPNENITSSSPPAPDNDKFIYGAIQSIWSYPNYDSLRLNATHCYVSTVWDTVLQRHVPKGWASDNDCLMTPVTGYANDLRRAKDIMYQHNQSRFFYQRPKIEWLAFGQSSVYECEDDSHVDNDLWFYAFNVSNGTSEQDNTWNNGKWVLHCGQPQQGPNAGIVIKQLKANTEQCKSSQSDGSDNHWQYDSESTWYIKPRIRIDSAWANNPSNFNTLVCRIDIKNQNGNTFKSVDLRARNFLVDTLGTYNGRYIEEFAFLQQDTARLTYTGAWGDWWGLSARGNRTNEQGYNLTDIQVYWYDNCDMWIDYIKVENDVAHDLLTSDTTNQTHQLYNQWLEDEAKIAIENPAAYKFYIEIIEFNNLPCINYVNQKLREYSNNQIDLIVDFDPAWGLFYHVNYADLCLQ